MSLAVGTKAPDFTLSTKTGDGPKQIKLSDNLGKKNTLLLFFPMAFTGTCTTEMCASFLPQMNLGMSGVPKRSAFVIDRNGVIQYSESNDDARQLPNFQKIKAKLEELK